MKILTTFDDNFLLMARSFINSLRHYSSVPVTANLASSSKRSIEYCKQNNIEYNCTNMPKLKAKPTSRLLKMSCADACPDIAVYMDIDIIFQGDISTIEDLNPNYIWVLSNREGHQTSLRSWKKHYFVRNDVDFVRKHLPKLDPEIDVEKALRSPVRNCGVIYSNGILLKKLFNLSSKYYHKLLEVNKTQKIFSDSDQLCFVLAFMQLEDKIKELPVRFNRMPYHQSYDYKNKSSFLIPGNIVLHLNCSKQAGEPLVNSWAKNCNPIINPDANTRSGIIVPIQTSSVAERALTKNLYSLAVSNKGNLYKDEDVGFPISSRIDDLDKVRDRIKGERPAYDRGLFFMFNNFLFMIDHGEYTGKRAQWLIGKYVNSHQLAGIFIEQMDKSLDISLSKIPIIPLAYGIKEPNLWISQGKYHNLGIGPSKYTISFFGDFSTNKIRSKQAQLFNNIPGSNIQDIKKSNRISFDEYMKIIAASKIVWCPPGGRPKTHREIEAMCCEVAVLMPEQHILEPETLEPDVHYICVKPDYSDAIQKCQYYLDHEDKRKEIAHNGRMWYERNASDYARSKYIHDNCIKIIRKIS